jgi:uncharacterized membrane protein
MAEGAGFCPSCGAAQAGAGGGSTTSVAQTGMQENIAGLLCYSLGWLTGLIFYFIDKRPFVRFHAAQSIVVFGGLHLIGIVFGMFFGLSLMTGGWTGFSLGIGLFHALQLLGFILWIFLMIKAFQGERFRVPFAADVADKIFGKS